MSYLNPALKFASHRSPRYTSYPTAPHFHPGVGAEQYGQWLGRLSPCDPISLYIHIPYCRELCWYCGCNMRATQKDEPIARYVETLLKEIALVKTAIGQKLSLSHLAFGGGTPTIVTPDQLDMIMTALHGAFDFNDDAELAIEIDPRTFDAPMAQALKKNGFTRASLGIQSFDLKVQSAINRVQSYDVTKRCFDVLREVGIDQINADLLYGLPFQTRGSAWSTAEAIVTLNPDRLAVFGYAHVPHMKSHQNLIPEDSLPDAQARLHQEETMGEVLLSAGYERVGFDHYAKPNDALARCAREGRMHRNFQGYTTDSAPVILGLGASSIGRTCEGYVQNHPHVRDWASSVNSGQLPVHKGVALDEDDRLRAEIIERILCDFEVSPGEIAAKHHLPVPEYDLSHLLAEGIVTCEAGTIIVNPDFKPLSRLVAAAFDAYLTKGAAKHSVAV